MIDLSKKWFGMCPSFDEKSSDSDEQIRRANPYALYRHEDLSPRSSGWLYISAVSIACLSSYLNTERPVDEAPGSQSGAGASIDELIVILLSTSFALSLLVLLFYQHRDLREKLTMCLGIRSFYYSPELFLALTVFGMWCVLLRYLTDPISGINYGLNMLTIDGEQDLNINIWVCSWLGWGLASYLVGELIMAPPEKLCGVWIRDNNGYTNYQCHDSARIRNSTTQSMSRDSTVDVNRSTHDQGESSVANWFMLLSFSSCLAAYSFASRSGYACAGDLSRTPFCKRLWLGGAIGIFCALLAFAALALFGINKMGSFDHWGSRKEIILPRVDAALSVLSLILLSINLGYGTSTSGPSTEMSNLYISSSMGVILSLILCERARHRSVERLLPSPPPPGNELIEISSVRSSGCENDGDYDSSASSSSSSSSSSPSPSQGSSRCVLTVEDYRSHPQIRDHPDIESCDINTLSSSSQYLTVDPSTDFENQDRSTFPDPDSTSSMRLAPFPDDRLEIESHCTDEDMYNDDFERCDDSGVIITFRPDDVSSIGDSMMTPDKMEPDGYKADEMYTYTATNHAPTSSSKISVGKPLKQSSTLITVPEQNIHTKSSRTSNGSSMQHSKEKIKEIMNRLPDERGS